MSDGADDLAITFLSELFMVDQLARALVSKALPRGMELSHFSVLNHLAHVNAERSPTELALLFHVSRAAMTNTLSKLEIAGHVHIRPDWDDARRKFVAISPAGRAARDAAFAAVGPLLGSLVRKLGPERVRSALPLLREFRAALDP